MPIKVLALDLEGTLISNALSQIPRPGLHGFLTGCKALFPRVVMFTAVEEDRFRPIARRLVEEGAAPAWFADIEFVHWHGETKDLSFIPGVQPSEALLVDDFEPFVHPGQEKQWMPVECFDPPYEPSDAGLLKVMSLLLGGIGARG